MIQRASLLFAAALLVVTAGAHADREPLPHDRAFPPRFQIPVSFETGRPVYGWGGSEQAAPLAHTPILFVHGNTVDATFWREARSFFRAAGYGDDELWAPGYGYASTWHFDSNDLSAATLDAFVNAVQDYLAAKTGRRVPQVDIVAHSLGVTVVRQWLTQTNRWHEVRNFIAVAGANHGTWTAYADATGPSRIASFELFPGGPWLAQLNRHGEVAGSVRTMTLHDGTGRYDVFYPPPLADSPALAGATNLAINRERGGGFDHLELPRAPATLQAMLDFIRAAPEPLPNAQRPALLRDGDAIRADQAEALVRCVAGGRYPNAADPPAASATLGEGITTCYAENPKTALVSPMARYLRTQAAPRAEWKLRATTEGKNLAKPVTVSLSADDPTAFIVYSLAGTAPDSGAALYDAPITVAGPLRLTAVAIAADGKRTQPLVLDYALTPEYRAALEARKRRAAR